MVPLQDAAVLFDMSHELASLLWGWGGAMLQPTLDRQGRTHKFHDVLEELSGASFGECWASEILKQNWR